MIVKHSVKQISRIAAICLLLTTTACFTKTDVGGYVDDINVEQEVIIGQTTRDEVTERLGSPSAVSSFGEEIWYYISDRMETVAFLKPEITDQKVLRIAFDGNGVVSDIRHLTRNDALAFDFVSRETPTEGHSMGIIEQLVGNIGRFNNGPGGGLNRRPGSVPGGGPGGF